MSLLHILLTLLIVTIWGVNFVLIKVALVDISPIFLCCMRFFLTSLPAVFFIKRPKAPFRRIVRYGLIMFALQFSLLFMGMYAGVSAGLASILLQMQVFFGILLGVLIFEEKLHPCQIVGGLISFTGIAFVAKHFGGSITVTGFLFVMGAALCWALGNVISKKIGKVDMLSLVVWASLVAWPPLLVMSLLVEGPDQILHAFEHITWASLGAVLYITYLSTLLAFGVWNWLLHHYRLGIIAPFTLLVPISGILSSAFFLGEPLQFWKIMATALVILGLCINSLGPRLLARLQRK